MRRTLALALLAAAPPALAVDWNGSADVGYVQNDAWSGTVHDRQPTWDFGGQLALSAAPLRPGLLFLNGAGSWRQYQSQYAQTSSKNRSLGYNLSANVLGEKPLSFLFGASRSWSDFTATTATTVTGSTLVTTESASAGYNAEGLPVVVANLAKTDYDNHSFSAVANKGSATTLSVGASQALDGYGYAANYDTSWNTGSFAETNYRSHFVTISANANPTKQTEVRLSERYFLRQPTLFSDLNPRFDDNSLGIGATYRSSERTNNRLDYLYRHLVVDAPTVGDRETLTHSLSAGTDHRLSEELWVTGDLGASFGRDRAASADLTVAGEQVGTGLRWQRAVDRSGSVYAAVSGTLGAQQVSGSTSAAYGAGATVGGTRTVAGMNGNASYSANYQSNLGTTLGWTLAQQLTGSLDGRSRLGGRARFSLNASQTRRGGDVLFGSSRNESLTANAMNAWRLLDLALSAGLSNSVGTALSSPVGSSVLLPSSFNSQSRFASATATTHAWSISWSALARYLDTTSPGRPRQYEQGVGLQMAYQLGAFTFSAEDRYSVGGTPGATQRGNLFFARLSRSFGGAF